MTNLRLAAVMLLCTPLLLAGCRRPMPVVAAPLDPPPAAVEAAPPPPPAPPPAAPEPVAAAPAPLSEDDIFARKTLDELNAERPLGAVLFDYDRFTIRDDARALLQQNAAWLQRWTSTRVTIEGHCDARGTNEYNLALGERRGQAIREYLVGLGIDGGRLTVVSKGEEEPLCFDEHETCWQQNRRGHSIITAK